jgi:hypothetical protein
MKDVSQKGLRIKTQQNYVVRNHTTLLVYLLKVLITLISGKFKN